MGNDLTKGNVFSTLIHFTLPFLFANVIQNLYSIVDMAVVGRLSSSVELSAVSVGSLITSTLSFFIMGFGTAGTVIVGRLVGAKEDKKLSMAVGTIYTVIPIVSVAVMVLTILFHLPLLRVMNTPDESFDSTVSYVLICAIGLIFTGCFNAIAAVLRGMGDSKGPTVFITFACLLNIAGDVILVGSFHMGAAGAAIATSAAQGLSVVFGSIYLKRKKFPFLFVPKNLKIDHASAKQLFRLGLPAAMQETLVGISFVILESLVNSLGYVATAAAGIDDRIFYIAVIPSSAFCAAIAAMVAQNDAAGLYNRARQSLYIGAILSLIVGLLVFAVMTVIPEKIIGIFTTDKDVIAYGTDYMRAYRFDFVLCSVSFCFNGYINGVGNTKYTMYLNLASSFLFRIPLCIILLNHYHTLFHLGISLPVSTCVQLSMGVGYVLLAKSERRKRSKSLIE